MILMFNDDEVVPKGDHPGNGLIEHMRQHDVINASERHAGGMLPSEHADWVIDLGPGGGVNGGKIIAEGPREVIASVAVSATGQYLKPILERASVKPVIVQSAPKKPRRSRSPGLRSGGQSLDEEEPDLIAAK